MPWRALGGDGMKLYYAPGTISLMPHVALLESALPFIAVRVDEVSKRTQDGEDYRAVSPLGYVPALALDDGSLLLEAAAIAQYVADRDPTGRLAPPNGTIERTRLQASLQNRIHTMLLAERIEKENAR
jgi:glutathione S-transferase